MANDARPWYKDPPKLVAVLGTAVAAAIGVTQLVDKFLVDDPPSASAEYILDVSSGMRGNVGKTPKLDVAKAEILSHVRNTPSLSTALRLAGGGSCSSGYREPDVGFGEGNGDEFDEALQRAEARGESDFASVVSHAVSDFIGRQKAAASKSKTMYVFVGSQDTCSPRPEAVVKRALRDLSVKKDVEVSLRFVGVKLPPRTKRVLRSINREAKSLGYRSEVQLANKPGEIGAALRGECEGPRGDQYSEPC